MVWGAGPQASAASRTRTLLLSSELYVDLRVRAALVVLSVASRLTVATLTLSVFGRCADNLKCVHFSDQWTFSSLQSENRCTIYIG